MDDFTRDQDTYGFWVEKTMGMCYQSLYWIILHNLDESW